MKRTAIYLALTSVILLSSGIKPANVKADQQASGISAAITAINLLLLGRESIDLELVARIRANILLPPSLELVDAPDMQPIVDEYLNGPEGRQWAIVLGKSFFWDQGAGSNGQACASCHFRAGADPRSKNQMSPGLNNTIFDFTGPNYQMASGDFPMSRDIDNVVSSQGVFSATFTGVESNGGDDVCIPTPSNTFAVDGTEVRQVVARNAPTVINAVLNARNFWDGRANNFFNGVDPHGRRTNLMNPLNPADPSAGQGIWVLEDTGLTKVQIGIPLSSLASQAVGPILSDVEMSCSGRTFPHVAQKMLARSRALVDQAVHPDDSVLGPYRHSSGLGINLDYAQLIQRAFQEKYWNGGPLPGGSALTQLKANFSLFWGLAIQFYEATLFSNQTPFDSFARGDDRAMTNNQLRGLEVFLTNGQCILCHGGQEFTSASVRLRTTPIDELEQPEAMERMLMMDGGSAVYDGGFYNIGATPTAADRGIGAALGELPFTEGGELQPIPLCYSRQAAEGPNVDPESTGVAFNDDLSEPAPVAPGERVACDGAFKTPTIRNVALTAPYFHNGSHATLKQVMTSYRLKMADRFAINNLDDLHPLIPMVDITEEEEDRLVDFMKALTDSRVALEQAPFDHPGLRITNGHSGDHQSVIDRGDGLAEDIIMSIPAVGAQGFIPALHPFLGIAQ